MNLKSERQWSDPLRYMAMVGIGILLFAGIFIARSRMSLILIALIIAYLLSPLANFFMRIFRMKRSLAVGLAYLLLLILVIVILVLIVPFISEKIRIFLSTDWVTVIQKIDQFLEETIRELEVKKLQIGNIAIDLSVPLTELRKALSSIQATNVDLTMLSPDFSEILQSAVSVSASVIGKIFAVLITIITTLMASLHFCNDGMKMKKWIVEIFSPPYRREINELLTRLIKVWNNYFIGELKLMLIIGVVTTIVCAGLGLRWALLLGLIAGFFEVVPNIGPFISLIPAIVSALIFGSSWLPFNNFVMALVVIAAYILIQQLENILVVPRVMGEALDLHPVVVILGILILSSRLGVVGALLAAPILGLIKVICNFTLNKIRGEDPYPEIYRNEVAAAVESSAGSD